MTCWYVQQGQRFCHVISGRFSRSFGPDVWGFLGLSQSFQVNNADVADGIANKPQQAAIIQDVHCEVLRGGVPESWNVLGCCVMSSGECKGNAIPLQSWTDPEGSRRLRLPDFKTIGIWKWYCSYLPVLRPGVVPSSSVSNRQNNRIKNCHWCWHSTRTACSGWALLEGISQLQNCN